MADIKKFFSKLIVFKEPEEKPTFELKENEQYGADLSHKKSRPIKEQPINKEGSDKDRKKQVRIKKDNDGQHEISKKLKDSLEYLKKIYSVPTNSDVIVREFDITFRKKTIAAFIIFIDGLVNKAMINSSILQPLMLLSNIDIKTNKTDISMFVKSRLLPQNQLKVVKTYEEAIDDINFGECGIFIDGVEMAFLADVKGWEHRTVERPNTELIIRGPQEGFTEVLRSNTALIRKILKDSDLVVENLKVGKRSKTLCSMLYIKDIVNDSIVEEVRRRIKNINVDYFFDSGELEQLIEDNPFLPVPQMIATERPDRVAYLLSEGRVALILNGSPFALVMPITNSDLVHASEDSYVRFPYSNLLRIIRILGIFTSLLLPGVYVAITNYHNEMIPTDLLLAIEAWRERVPFPSVVEIMIMEVSFELIREAGIRIPGPIGPTLGIIGALILGQAAVAANIVSPILIIIVAVTGIGSFAVPNFSLAFGFRILRFAFIFFGAMAGFLGISTGMFIMGLWFVSAKSFGVPFLSPFAPKTKSGSIDQLVRAPIWMQEKRPDYLNVKDTRKQPEISKSWAYGNDGRDKKDE